MAYYIVRAKPITDDLPKLKERLDAGEIRVMQPFGTALNYSLKNARIESDGSAVWEEEDYCSPPLAMEREAVLDTYFTGIEVEKVSKGEGWKVINHLPGMWE